MNDFELDYQHGRKNLGEVIHKTKMANMLPKIKFLHSYEFVKDKNIGMDAKEMGNRVIESMDTAFKNWKPKEKYTLEAV